MASARNAEAAVVVLAEISRSARYAVGSIAPALAGLSAWADAHGTKSEATLPIDNESVHTRTAARMVLAPLGGVDLAASPTLPAAYQLAVHANADTVLSELNGLGMRCLEALGKASPLPPPSAARATTVCAGSGFVLASSQEKRATNGDA